MEPLQVDQQEPTPPRLLLKLISAGFAFFVAGINDGSLGALIPYIRDSYHINTDLVSVVYGTTFAGWLLAAISNSHLSQYLHLGSFLALGAFLQILAHALRAWLPPFALFAVTFFLAALGQAYQDTYANTFVASVKSAHRWLGFIHAMYMAGCLVAPFVSTAVASSESGSGAADGSGSAGPSSRWSLFYVAPLGLGTLNLGLALFAFWDLLGFKSRGIHPGDGQAQRDGDGEAVSPVGDAGTATGTGIGAGKEMWMTLSMPSVWAVSLYFFFFLGAVITAGGWIVEYLVHVRDGDLKQMGYVPAGFYGGAFLGRLLLAEPTYRFGERRMVFVYVCLCLALELIFWLVPNIITEAVAISLLGFFSGPFFATGISVASKLFSVEIRASALVFIFVLGQIGGSVFPAITGVIAARVGVKVLQPVLVALLGATGVTWLLLPKSRLHHD